MIILASTVYQLLSFQNNTDKSAQTSVPILIDSLGQNKFASQWRIVEEGQKKGEKQEEVYNI